MDESERVYRELKRITKENTLSISENVGFLELIKYELLNQIKEN